jgi:hypothetical protein
VGRSRSAEPGIAEEALDLIAREAEPDVRVLSTHPLVRVLYLVGDRDPASGRVTRVISASMAAGLVAWCSTMLATVASTARSRRGRVSDVAFGELDVVDAEAVHVGAGNFQH